ncbi:MAG: NHL repeat-containing protein [Treponema sp.]|jgi:DNA-binding beta-propeller fold protein YncE|nr:NHL repeat-containing protein [Treponema sp.]
MIKLTWALKPLPVALLFLFAAPFLAAQSSYITGGGDINAINAAEEFRIGIHAYNRYAFNEAILSFERALSFRPGEAIIMDWLGKAYYRSGFESTALRQWRAAVDAYGKNTGAGMIINNRIETVANRRMLFPIADDDVRYLESGRYPGRYEENILYRQPTAVLPHSDGSVWVVAYGSNEIVRIDVNGVIKDRKHGPLNGFDRPYDLVRGAGGRMYLSEYRGGRVSILNPQGDWLAYIGSKGLGRGMFVGPQNLAVDEDGYLYVVDYGNQRISKFDPDGVFVLSFGLKSAMFPGFDSPTGIAVKNGRIFAADSMAKCIYMFDPNGNYLGILTNGLTGPESLRFLSDGRLLAADTNRVLLIDTDSAIVRELGVAGNPRTRIVGADMDSNGSLLAANFAASEVSVLTRFDDLASGLFVQIERIYAEQFPQVTLEVRVEDRLRRPIVGLESLNFLISEGGRVANGQTFLVPAYRVNRADVSVLFERSPLTTALRDDFAAALRDINNALGAQGKIVSVVSAGEQPQRERHENALDAAARGNSVRYSSRWRFDQGLRLAATDLLPGEKRRSVVYVGSGNPGALAFEQYSLSEMAAYLANNGIVFNAVLVGGVVQPSEEIRYLCRETGGKAFPLYRPEGIKEVIESIAFVPNGLYFLNYQSALPTDFGRAWLPVETEVYLMERSGRDTSGYFPPLE